MNFYRYFRLSELIQGNPHSTYATDRKRINEKVERSKFGITPGPTNIMWRKR